jgi:hypothetical protein
MDEIIKVILLLFICGEGHKLYARGRQIFKYEPAYSWMSYLYMNKHFCFTVFMMKSDEFGGQKQDYYGIL